MRLTVLGGCGTWPEAGQACSGFLVEHDGFRLLMDAGYATVPRLLQHISADELDAVFISHGHQAPGGRPVSPVTSSCRRRAMETRG